MCIHGIQHPFSPKHGCPICKSDKRHEMYKRRHPTAQKRIPQTCVHGVIHPYSKNGCPVCFAEHVKQYQERANARKREKRRSTSKYASRKRTSLERYFAKSRANMMTRRRCTVSLEELLVIWQDQNGQCAYCGSLMTWEDKKPFPTKLSIDRIDNELSYISGNIAMACLRCNRMKGTLSRDEFLQHCLNIVNHLGTIPGSNG